MDHEINHTVMETLVSDQEEQRSCEQCNKETDDLYAVDTSWAGWLDLCQECCNMSSCDECGMWCGVYDSQWQDDYGKCSDCLSNYVVPLQRYWRIKILSHCQKG